MKRNFILTMLVILISVFFVGCGQSGSEYLGKWVNIKSADYKLEIKKNGDNFIVAQTIPNFFSRSADDKELTHEYPAILKDGVLTINADFGQVTVAHVKEDDTILLKEGKYKRVK